MSKMFNIENCDVTMENGCLRLIYHTDELLMPMTLAISKTYHDLNEKGMYLFGQEDWVGNVVEWSIRKESPIWHNLLTDIYKNHHDLYSSIMVTPEDDEYDDDVDDNDKVLGYLTLEATGDIDEKTGHRIAHFNTADLEALDNGILHVLAETCGIKDGEYMFRDELINAMSQQDIDMDDCDYDCENCDWAEKISDGDVICHLDEDDDEEEDDNEDLCDGDCDHCKSDAPDTDSDCSCNPVENENAAQPDERPYEYVDGPAHYHGTECIENMRKLFGDEAVRWFCICNAYKYRFRDGSKPGVTAEQDEKKARWYEDYAVKMMNEQRYY